MEFSLLSFLVSFKQQSFHCRQWHLWWQQQLSGRLWLSSELRFGPFSFSIWHFVAAAILFLIHSAPASCFCERQGSVETTTYSSEFVAAGLATGQIMNHMPYTTPHILSAPAHDNTSVITSSNILYSSLSNNALSYQHIHRKIT